MLAVVGDLIAAHCRSLEDQAEALADPVERLRFYVFGTLSALGIAGTTGARFMTSQHWRLHQEWPDELAAATKPFADLVQHELEAGRETGQLHPRDPERDAWIINKLVMSVFHHYAFVDDDPRAASVAEDVWQFCLAAVGGAPDEGAKPAKRRRAK
jgi:hypothetical protein